MEKYSIELAKKEAFKKICNKYDRRIEEITLEINNKISEFNDYMIDRKIKKFYDEVKA